VQTTVDDPWRAGMGKGMSDAMDRIVAYYIRLADKIFPVLELDSGRRLDIVLSQGVTVAEDTSAPAPAAMQEEEINGAARFGRAVRSQE
jgi:conjugal transfer pilus assembly protein TraB